MKFNLVLKSKTTTAILLSFLFVSGNTLAQSFYDNNLYVFNWGYGKTNASFQSTDAATYKVNVGHFPVTYEYLSRHAYFYSDLLTPMIDLCLGAFNREFWWGHAREGMIYNGGDWPLARLAFGGYFGDKVGLYAGGQWGYSRWRMAPGEYIDGKLVYFNTLETELGGHTFGPGVHSVLDFNKFMVRNSIMYDFVTNGFKGARYTNTITWDIMAMYGLTKDNMIGLFANYVYSPGRTDVKISKLRIGLSIAFNN